MWELELQVVSGKALEGTGRKGEGGEGEGKLCKIERGRKDGKEEAGGEER